MPALQRPTAVHPAKVQLSLTDLVAVQRVLVLLTGRNHPVTHLEAEEAGAGRWRLTLDTIGARDDLDLLEARLLRLPAVLTVDVLWPGRLSAAG